MGNSLSNHSNHSNWKLSSMMARKPGFASSIFSAGPCRWATYEGKQQTGNVRVVEHFVVEKLLFASNPINCQHSMVAFEHWNATETQRYNPTNCHFGNIFFQFTAHLNHDVPFGRLCNYDLKSDTSRICNPQNTIFISQ